MIETFIFTPVLRGAHNSDDSQTGILRCSVHVGVRLSPTGTAATLASYPTFANWPSAMPQLSIVLNGTTLQTTAVNPAPTQQLWDAFFPPVTSVREYQVMSLPPKANDVWFDAGQVSTQVQNHYASAALSFLQPVRPLLPRPIIAVIKTEEELRDVPAPEPIKIQPTVPLTDPILNAAYNFFYKPQPPAGPYPPAPIPADPDIHELIAYLHETPAALRSLGLIIELEAPLPSGLPSQQNSISIAVTFPAGYTPSHLSPVVYFSPADLERVAGFEDLGSLQVIPYDPMHAAHLYSRYTGGPLPALRSGGLSLMWRAVNSGSGNVSGSMDRIRKRVEVFARYQNYVANPVSWPPSPLTISDLARGHRIDVWDGQAWHSLCQITGTVGRNATTLPIDTEGIVSSSVAVDPSVSVDPADQAVRANDTLAYWNGWSLCKQRPVQVPPGNAPLPADTRTAFQTTRSVKPGTLPRLRFGKHYRFLARRVDIAGNSLPPTTGSTASDLEQATPAQSFLRLEPLGSPVMAFATPPGPGESSTQIIVSTTRFSTVTSITPPTASVRFVLPPETTVDMAEKHGVLDNLQNPYLNIQNRLQASNGSLWNTAHPSTSYPSKAAVLQGQTYSVPSLPVPYLPDPACDGFALIAHDNGSAIGLENGASLSSSFSTAGDYPDNYETRTLRLTPGATGSVSKAADGTGIDIVLPPGERVTLGLASTIAGSALGQFALPQWASTAGAMPDNYLQNVQSGLVPALTPNRTLELIHAVQQPLSPPVIQEPILFFQQPGDLAATFSVALSCDVKTTSTVTLEASWTEWIDSGPGSPTPGAKAITAYLATLSGTALASGSQAGNRYVFGDTKARNSISIIAIATSSFAEFFPGADCTIKSTTPSPAIRYATQAPAPPRFAYAIPAFKWTRTMASETGPFSSTRQGNALRIYLERPWYTSGVGELLALIAGPNTVWGADPLSAAQAPAGTPFGNTLFNQSLSIQAVHPVEYDPVTDRYYSDVIFDPKIFGIAYKPFVQFEIAAYQPNADPALQLSTTQIVPFTQILPDRTFTASLSAGTEPGVIQVTASIQGIGPQPSTPGSYTSAMGRGIQTQITIVFAFHGVPVGGPPPTTMDVVLSAPQFSYIDSTPQSTPPMSPEGALWTDVDVTVQEWELMSPDQQPMEIVIGGFAITRLPGPRPCRLIYSETVNLNSGYVPPVTPPLPWPVH
jgi:hypothetical protein